MNYTKESNITEEEIQELSKFVDNKFRKNLVSFNRLPDILRMRLSNITLRKISEKYNVIPERIRQSEAKGVEIICNKRNKNSYL